MIIFQRNGIPPMSGGSQPGQTRPASEAASKTDTERHFDKITITAKGGESAFLMEMKSRLSQEVRTTTTTGSLAALHRQFQAGEYRVNAEAIARRMLLLEEV